jgi:hypothetical protein
MFIQIKNHIGYYYIQKINHPLVSNIVEYRILNDIDPIPHFGMSKIHK